MLPVLQVLAEVVPQGMQALLVQEVPLVPQEQEAPLVLQEQVVPLVLQVP